MKWLIFSFLFLLSSCDSPNPTPTSFSGHVMTIDYHISIGDPLTQEKTKIIQKTIDDTFEEINQIYNKWNPSSEISLINTLPAHVWHPVSPELFLFLQKIDHFFFLSDGLFDPTIESLQKLWKERMEEGTIPSQKELEQIAPAIGWKKIHLKNNALLKEDGRTTIDLGGIAKGLCVDKLIEGLMKKGIQNAFVEWGGEIRAIGQHPSKRQWNIYISRLTNPDPNQAIAHIELNDQALATSGDYFQYWEVEVNQKKRTFCHIFNPKTLMPLEVKPGSIASATLLANDCVTADALAKVLMLFETVEEAQEWVKQLQKEHPSLGAWIVTRQ